MKFAILSEELSLKSGAAVAALSMASWLHKFGHHVLLLHADAAISSLQKIDATERLCFRAEQVGDKTELKDLARSNNSSAIRDRLTESELKIERKLVEFQPDFVVVHNFEYLMRHDWLLRLGENFKVHVVAHDFYVADQRHYSWFAGGEFFESRDWFSRILGHKAPSLEGITISAPSKWLTRILRSAEVTRGCHVAWLPNFPRLGMDKPVTHVDALSSNYFFVPVSNVNNGRKGFDIALAAYLNFRGRLSLPPSEITLLVGTSEDLGLQSLGVRTFSDVWPNHDEIGYSAGAMSSAYRSSVATIVPSRADNAPNVILESIASQRPVIATNVGGIPEIVEATRGGVLVRPENDNEMSLAMVRGWSIGFQEPQRPPELFDPEMIWKSHQDLWSSNE